jgi:hypothetical protein
MTVKPTQLAIALALTSSMLIATSVQTLADCAQNGSTGCFKKGTQHTVQQFYNNAPRAKLPHDNPYDDPQVKAIWEEAIGQ